MKKQTLGKYVQNHALYIAQQTYERSLKLKKLESGHKNTEILEEAHTEEYMCAKFTITDSVMCFAVRTLLARDWRLQNLLTNAGQVSRRLSDVKFMQTHKHNHADFAPICLLPCEWKPDT